MKIIVTTEDLEIGKGYTLSLTQEQAIRLVEGNEGDLLALDSDEKWI